MTLKSPRYTPVPRDVDDMAVERRIMRDRSVFLNKEERIEAVRILHCRGLTDKQVADQLGYARRTVIRIRQRRDLPANYDHGNNPVWIQRRRNG